MLIPKKRDIFLLKAPLIKTECFNERHGWKDIIIHALHVDSIQAFQFEDGLDVGQSRLRRPCDSVMRHWEELLTMHPLIAYSYPPQTAKHHHDKQDPIIF